MRFFNRRTVTCAAVFHLVVLAAPSLAVIEGLPVADSDRQYDAVGLVFTVSAGSSCGGFVSGTCTLVGPDIVMLARHSVAGNGLPPANGRTHRVRFRRAAAGAVTNAYTNDCSAPFQEIHIAEFWATSDAGVDMVLGRLETAPTGIRPIPALPSYVPRGGENITLAGWGYSGRCLQSGDAWALRTRTAALPANPRWTPCCFVYNTAALSAGCVSAADAARWAIGNLHDSGAPILIHITIDGQPRPHVIGIVRSQGGGITTAAWNRAGGTPALPIAVPTPPVCPADFNRSGDVSLQDLFDFLTAYMNAGAADINDDGAVSVQDVLDYVALFFAGC